MAKAIQKKPANKFAKSKAKHPVPWVKAHDGRGADDALSTIIFAIAGLRPHCPPGGEMFRA